MRKIKSSQTTNNIEQTLLKPKIETNVSTKE